MLFKNQTVGYLICLFFIVILFGCKEPSINQVNQVKPQCLSSQSNCIININKNAFSVLFNVKEVTPEDSFSIIIPLSTLASKYSSNDLPIKNSSSDILGDNVVSIISINGHIEGINMYMGKIPLFFEHKKEAFIANVMVGSCTEENMKWRLLFKIRYQLNGDELEVIRTIDI